MRARRAVLLSTAAMAATTATSDALPIGSDAHGAGGAVAFELVRKPIAVYGRDAGQPIYLLYVRLNRPVPRNPSGRPAAAVRLGGLGLSRPPTSSSMGFLTARSNRGRYCYEQQLVLPLGPDPPAMGDPRPGRRLSVHVLIRGLDEPLRATVALRRRVRRVNSSEPYLRELRCFG